MSSRPFTFKINAAEFFSVVNALHHKQRSTFLLQFATDLVTLNPALDYSKKIIGETLDFISKQSEHGKKGGRPLKRKPKGSLKAPLTDPKGSPKPKEEVKEEEPIYSPEFLSFWEAYPKKTAKGAAWQEWQKFKPPLDKVLATLKWQVVSQKWKDGYILDPERYIKKRSWEDEPPKATAPRQPSWL